jgi:hypothetical protein
MTKQTAVEYLVEQLFPKALSEEQYYHIEQAKEMEKEQIEGAYIDGAMGAFDKTYKGMHEYYNETYGGENEQD